MSAYLQACMIGRMLKQDLESTMRRIIEAGRKAETDAKVIPLAPCGHPKRSGCPMMERKQQDAA